MKLDIACGDNKKEGFVGIDRADIEGVDIVHDLNIYPWPIEDNSVDEINCAHYLEHIPHRDWQSSLKESNSFKEFKEKALTDTRDGVIKFFDELYRILKPGGKATIKSPYVTHVRSFGDPTHTRYIHDWSFYYVNKEWRDREKLSHYGIKCDFDVKYSYFIDESLILKSEEVRNEAFKKEWNSILDIIVELQKR